MNPSEENLEYLRQRMVDEQLLRRDIRDKNVTSVFRKVPRHRFVDPAMRLEAYGDFPVSIGKGQTISQPYMVALMAQVLDVKKNDKVLEIGTGSGYETAILAELGGEIFSIERIEGLAKKAGKVLEEFGYKNIHIKTGDGTLGWQEHAPFDKIIVTASSQDAPQPLLDQLREGGKMVMPVGSRFTQRLLVLEKEKGRISERDVCGCVFVPLIGEFGWGENCAGKDS
ncbi:MAG: protein-L-isoaspartate(D-aspartate) O-methyltransferase [Candidatus Omnitrophica bacterium]|nr:protein-L-isoaspartate(D-aspartate) O-methyltransferase [Candidatus Omnitrophota bacterium]